MELLLRNFRIAFRASEWVQRRMSRAGLLVGALLLAAGLFGLDTRQSSAYQVFALAFAMLAWALLMGARFRPRLRILRRLPDYATVGEAFEYPLTVENASPRAFHDLLLRDEPDPAFPTAAQFAAARPPGDAGRNWFDRRVGYPRFAWLTRRLRGFACEERHVARIAAGASTVIGMRLTPLRRGRIRLAGVTLARLDPLGLLKRARHLPASDTLLVLPRRYPVPDWVMPGHRVYQPGGVSLAARVGDAEEFMALREYQPGDPLRHIDWKAWARAGRPIVRQYQDEYFVRHALVLDTFVAGATDTRFESAVSVAASFAAAPRSHDSLLDLVFVESRAYRFTAGRALHSVEGLLRVLACVEPAADDAFGRLAAAVLSHAGSLSGCICVFLAWNEARRELAARLLALGVPLRVIVLLDEDDARPEPGPMAAHTAHFHPLSCQRIEQDLPRL